MGYLECRVLRDEQRVMGKPIDMKLKSTLRALWQCEQGIIITSEFVVLSVLLMLGVIVGATTYRDQLMQEFGDAAISVSAVNQSYSYAGTVRDVGFSAGGEYVDNSDFCDELNVDPIDAAPGCIVIDAPPSNEQAQ